MQYDLGAKKIGIFCNAITRIRTRDWEHLRSRATTTRPLNERCATQSRRGVGPFTIKRVDSSTINVI
jgi:hypothetical protein